MKSGKRRREERKEGRKIERRKRKEEEMEGRQACVVAVNCNSSSVEVAGICLDSVASQSSLIKGQAPDQ